MKYSCGASQILENTRVLAPRNALRILENMRDRDFGVLYFGYMEQENRVQHMKQNGSNIFLGIVAILTGVFALLVGFGLIQTDGNDNDVPLGIARITGGIFFVAGVMALGIGKFPPRLYNILGAVLMTLFSFIAGWVAFGPGNRVFGGAGPMLGRMVFGFSAFICVYMAIVAWKRVFMSEVNEGNKTIVIDKPKGFFTLFLFLFPFMVWPFVVFFFVQSDGSWKFPTLDVLPTTSSTMQQHEELLNRQGFTLHTAEKNGTHIFDGAIIVAFDKQTGAIVGEAIIDMDGNAQFILPYGHYEFRPHPLKEDKVVGSLDFDMFATKLQPTILYLSEIGPHGFGTPLKSCEEKKDVLAVAVENKNYCDDDGDCKFLNTYFGCPYLVNRHADLEIFKDRDEDVLKSCPTIVDMLCPLSSQNLRCEKHSCVSGSRGNGESQTIDNAI